MRPLLLAIIALMLPIIAAVGQQAPTGDSGFWARRDTILSPPSGARAVRIAIWDSGVDTTLFPGRLARDTRGQVLLRGYDAHKRRQDLPMAVLPPHLVGRTDELNEYLLAFDDADSGIDSERLRALGARLDALSDEDRRKLEDAIGEWSGFAHGTGVTDIALTGGTPAEVVIARMEWWHGSPPVPCWTRELAVREAESISDLLAFVVGAGARVVNMSWNRAENSYLSNLAECAPEMPIEDRRALARFTVDTIRAVLQHGMRSAPQVLFVGAAGNAGTSLEAANPATRFSLPNFLLVGAVDGDGARARFTNSGPEVTLFATGFRVPARLPGGTLSFPSGTSMAAPLVTRAAAMVLAVNPSLAGAELRRLLENTSDANATGDRLLHTARAVRAAHGTVSGR